MNSLTSEIFESNDLTVYQPASGHRYGEESLALTRFIKAAPGLSICELGSGCGIISLVMAADLEPKAVTAVEIQKTLHEIALYNISENEFDDVVTCVNEDMRKFAKGATGNYDVVVSNPPFFTAADGRLSPDDQRAAARHELNGTIEDFVKAAHSLLKPGGKFFVVFDVRRKKELSDAIHNVGFKVVNEKLEQDSAYFLTELVK